LSFFSLVLVFVLQGLTVANAQTPPPPPSTTGGANSNAGGGANLTSKAGSKEKKTTLNFEDELVEGATSKPELFYLFQKKNFNYKRLIRLRENFLPEMRRTSEDIQRSRSSN
jgi:hypothetical protein